MESRRRLPTRLVPGAIPLFCGLLWACGPAGDGGSVAPAGMDGGGSADQDSGPRLEAGSPFEGDSGPTDSAGADGGAVEGGPFDVDGGTEAGPSPAPAPEKVRRFVAASLGYDHACAVTEDGVLACWGDNSAGQLGLGDTVPRGEPTRVGDGADWRQVSCGRRHCCGVREDGYAWCWGEGEHGQLGLDVVVQPVPARSVEAEAVVAGDYHTCVLVEGRAACFGLGAQGRLGDGDEMDRNAPTAVMQGDDYTSLALGAAQGCGVRASDGLLECWGRNQAGQLGAAAPDWCAIGQGEDPCVRVPTVMDAQRSYATPAMGPEVTCAVDASQALRCWGTPLWGAYAGEVVAEDMATVSLGAAHGCSLDLEGIVWCWGANGNGQLGLGHRQAVDGAREVGLLEPATVVRAGALSSCALQDDGTLWCWGGGAVVDSDIPRWMTLDRKGQP